jgi:hypothetical protein
VFLWLVLAQLSLVMHGLSVIKGKDPLQPLKTAEPVETVEAPKTIEVVEDVQPVVVDEADDDAIVE